MPIAAPDFSPSTCATDLNEVVGIEDNEYAISHARSHAGPNEQYLTGDVEQHLAEVLAEPARHRSFSIRPPQGSPLA